MTIEPRRQETEPFGITYDRIRLDKVARNLVRRLGIRNVLELPAHGSKSMPGIYSLGFANAGCHVTLFDPEPQGVEVYERLGLRDRVTVVHGEDAARSGLDADAYDLVWNFVTLGFRPDFEEVLKEMHRTSRKAVMTVHCNGFNYGYPWHRFLHWALKLPWTHGQTDYFFPNRVRRAYRAAGIEPTDTGLFDMPWWPDPPGFRDVRLHLSGGDVVEDFDWVAPIEDVYRTGRIPPFLHALSKIEDLPILPPVRWTFSHLFYLVGQVDR